MTEVIADTGRRPTMHFAVDAWDPAYGSNVDLDGDLGASTAEVDPDVELPREQWGSLSPVTDLAPPSAVLFVDGVRRIDARVWIEQPPGDPGGVGAGASGICASYAAGVVVCNGHLATLGAAEVRRGLFTATTDGAAVATTAGDYPLRLSRSDEITDLSLALQRSLGEAELDAAAAARAALPSGGSATDDLLVVDGPLRGRTHLPRAIGYIKTHRAAYLPPDLNAVVGTLHAGQRTPLFRTATSWDRYSWYLRLPCPPTAPGPASSASSAAPTCPPRTPPTSRTSPKPSSPATPPRSTRTAAPRRTSTPSPASNANYAAASATPPSSTVPSAAPPRGRHEGNERPRGPRSQAACAAASRPRPNLPTLGMLSPSAT